jgi:heme A synthase
MGRPLLGVGIAATVAVVAIGALRSLNEAAIAPGAAPSVGSTMPLQTREAYVVPPATDDQSRIGAPIRLTNYLMHHGEYASGLTRTSVNSNVVGAELQPVVTDSAVAKPLAERAGRE